MKKRILAVFSALGLALILSSCAELEITEADLADDSGEVAAWEVQEEAPEDEELAEITDENIDESAETTEDKEEAEEADGLNQDGTQTDEEAQADSTSESEDAKDDGADYIPYYFRSEKLLNSHYEKHGIEMGFASAKEYEKAASDVVNNPDALHKTEAEDGDDVYYVEASNEFVIVSTDGYIRTYFNPGGGIDYYNRQ